MSRLPNKSRQPYGGPRKQNSMKKYIGIGVTLAVLLLACAAFGLQKLLPSHAAGFESSNDHDQRITTINGLKKISQIGSTQNVLDARGNATKVDPNPYKITLVPSRYGNDLSSNDVIVSNIGNEDRGVTLIKFADQKGPGHIFNKPNDGILGPAGLVLDKQHLLVGNSTGNNVLILNPNGSLFATINSGLFNGPWGITLANMQSEDRYGTNISFFTANKFDAKILRVDLFRQSGTFHYRVTQIAQFDKMPDMTKIDLHWFPVLKIGSTTWKDVLVALDPAHNRLAAIPNSSTTRNAGKGVTIFQGTPLNMPGGLGVNPLNGDLLVVNLMDNNLVEINPTLGKLVGTKQIDPAKVDKQGNGSALFGVVGTIDQKGNLRVLFTDDNTNTLNVLSAS